MKNYFTKTNIILLIALIISLIILFSDNCNQVLKPVITPVTDQVKEVEKSEALRIPVITDSMRIIKERDAAIIDLKLKLTESQSKLKRADKAISELSGVIVPETLQTTSASDYYTREEAITDLQKYSRQVVEECNLTISSLDSQITTQRKVIDIKDSMYFDIRQSFNQCIDQQKQLTVYSKKLEKKVKRTRATRWVWKAAALAGGVFILSSVIK